MTALISREEAVRHFRRASRSMNTRKAYASDWSLWDVNWHAKLTHLGG